MVVIRSGEPCRFFGFRHASLLDDLRRWAEHHAPSKHQRAIKFQRGTRAKDFSCSFQHDVTSLTAHSADCRSVSLAATCTSTSSWWPVACHTHADGRMDLNSGVRDTVSTEQLSCRLFEGSPAFYRLTIGLLLHRLLRFYFPSSQTLIRGSQLDGFSKRFRSASGLAIRIDCTARTRHRCWGNYSCMNSSLLRSVKLTRLASSIQSTMYTGRFMMSSSIH